MADNPSGQIIENPYTPGVTPEEKDKTKRALLSLFAVFCVEALFVFAIIMTILLSLNYFNIISLAKIAPSLIPSQSLPNKDEEVKEPETVRDFKRFQFYSDYAKQNFGVPFFINETQTWQAQGIFYGQKGSTIEIVTAEGVIELKLNSTTTFDILNNDQTEQNTRPGSNKKETLQSFLENGFGKVVQVYYIKDRGVNIIEEIYLLPDKI